MPELLDLTLRELRHLLLAGELSSRELTQSLLERIHRLEPLLKAFLTIVPERALDQADEVDRRINHWRKNKHKPLPTLIGIPVAIKDILCVAGMRCTCGSRILENYIPPFNATAVERLLQAGAIILGKTNTDEFAMGSSTENSAYYTTHNPWNLERVPGGSSGGRAVAVAAAYVPIALGTDTGGSVRQPASFCGVTGIKPTYGRVSRYGLVAYGSSLDVVGVFARHVEDVASIFTLIAGHDPLDATSVPLAVPEISLENCNNLAGLRIGMPEEYFIPRIQPEVDKSLREAIHILETFGAEVQCVSLPHTDYAVPVYYLIAPAEASANLARYDGIRYGSRAAADVMWDVFYNTRGKMFGAEVKRRIMLGTYALSAGYYDAYYAKAQKVRTLIKKDFEKAFEGVDVIAAPVAPTTAFLIGEHRDDPLAMYLEDIFTLPANLAGIPAISFPIGFDDQGLPIGMQIMAPHFREEVLFQVVYTYQQATSWHKLKPNL